LLVTALLSGPATALSVAQKKEIARTQFENAERMREALNGRPAHDRKARDYQRVIDAYRRVYYLSPTSTKADASAMAVAELLVEQGRLLKSDDILKAAVTQYEFLRREYPGSKYRVEALFTIAQIYKDDLNDNEKARDSFQEFLKRYSHTSQADDARAALKEMDADAAAEKAAADQAAKVADKAANSELPTPSKTSERHPTLLVTGVRHWSTPDYTRIAIDLEDEVVYDSGRIANPDRIYFDLKDTRLSSVLKGKVFEVEDGYLKKIRIAQFAPGLTRVVFEVGDDVGEYSAFLLPNPYRLIVDVHGKLPATLSARAQKQEAPSAKPIEIAEAKSPKPISTKSDSAKSETTTKTGEKKADTSAKRSEPQSEVADVEPTPEVVVKKIAPKKPAVPKAADAKDDSEIAADVVIDKAQPPATAKKEVPKKIVEPDPEPVATKPTEPVTVAKGTIPEPIAKEEPPVRIRGKKRQAPEKLNTHTARPTADGERSLVRALGLKIGRIVVDAGHGGHDTGTIGPNGLEEKNLVLDVALRLGKLLENRLGAEVVYTRDDDTFIPLETRTAIANQQQADLFISVHANSSRDENARGVETYYLNFTSSRDALEVAARENAVSEKSIHELQDLVKKIALKDKIEESREFAQDVQQSLHSGLASKAPAIRNRGVKKAPFIVLIGANMPSILAEISFISNPSDEKKLRSPEYRQKIAESLYRGVSRYTSGLSGVKVAQKIDTGD
jgi:N-acetylmuramoyl-L-alanine amidase